MDFLSSRCRTWFLKCGSRDGAVVRALASHQCVLGLISGPGVMWVEFVVGSRPCSEGFSPVLRFSLSIKTNISKFQFHLLVKPIWFIHIENVLYKFHYYYCYYYYYLLLLLLLLLLLTKIAWLCPFKASDAQKALYGLTLSDVWLNIVCLF